MLSEYGKILRIIRINNGELLNDMAQKVDVSPALLSYIENGKREIPLDLTDKLITCYMLDIEFSSKLMKAEMQSRKTFKINLQSDISTEKRETAMLFARTFNDIDDDVLSKIRELLEGCKR
jgi:transcriptional regulator with XRE-family HTH domain